MEEIKNFKIKINGTMPTPTDKMIIEINRINTGICKVDIEHYKKGIKTPIFKENHYTGIDDIVLE